MKKYVELAKCSLLSKLQYRANFVISIINVIIPFVINYVFWTAIFNSSPNEIIFGYQYNEMITYIIISNLVSLVMQINFANSVSEDIHSGKLNDFLMKPINYIQYKLANQLGQSIPVIILFILGSGIFVGRTEANLITVFLFYIATTIAFLLNNFIYYCIAVTSFWFIETGYIFWAIQEFIKIISGTVFPLTVLGAEFEIVSKFMPFQYVVYFPINILLNKINSWESFQGIIIQIAWSILLWFIAKYLWNKGIQKYVAVGG